MSDPFTSTGAYVRMHDSELCTDSFTLSRSFFHHIITKVVEFAIRDYGQAKSLTASARLPNPCCYFKLEAAVPKWIVAALHSRYVTDAFERWAAHAGDDGFNNGLF